MLKDLVVALQRDATNARKLKLFEHCVKKLNKLDEANDGFIETPEREALLDELIAIAHAAGLDDITDELDDWRDW